MLAKKLNSVQSKIELSFIKIDLDVFNVAVGKILMYHRTEFQIITF